MTAIILDTGALPDALAASLKLAELINKHNTIDDFDMYDNGYDDAFLDLRTKEKALNDISPAGYKMYIRQASIIAGIKNHNHDPHEESPPWESGESYHCDDCDELTHESQGIKAYDGDTFVMFFCNKCHNPNQRNLNQPTPEGDQPMNTMIEAFENAGAIKQADGLGAGNPEVNPDLHNAGYADNPEYTQDETQTEQEKEQMEQHAEAKVVTHLYHTDTIDLDPEVRDIVAHAMMTIVDALAPSDDITLAYSRKEIATQFIRNAKFLSDKKRPIGFLLSAVAKARRNNDGGDIADGLVQTAINNLKDCKRQEMNYQKHFQSAAEVCWDTLIGEPIDTGNSGDRNTITMNDLEADKLLKQYGYQTKKNS